MGGCWILFKCTKIHIAPSFSEQPKPGRLWLSPPPIKKSMMQITKPKTPMLNLTMVSDYIMSLADKHIQLSKCKLLILLFTATVRHQIHGCCHSLSPTIRIISMRTPNGFSKVQLYNGRAFIMNGMGNPYFNTCWHCTTEGGNIVLWHNCHRP
ncbi:hypothetical protein Cgig2_026268 [Carnegiea gigantea]|uniref:Uncharacterized protein n=1 Tax=Carnegiea gigantea TaxID=171969 RepID=A0A9Q1Q6W2_9CARY|nr:hypothetical protein Cgig2_026268 [Carnegiea gigantea]